MGVTTCISGGVTENPGVEDVSGPSHGLVLSPVSVSQVQSFITGAASPRYQESFTSSCDLGQVPFLSRPVFSSVNDALLLSAPRWS